jgi:hypothetical protein
MGEKMHTAIDVQNSFSVCGKTRAIVKFRYNWKQERSMPGKCTMGCKTYNVSKYLGNGISTKWRA